MHLETDAAGVDARRYCVRCDGWTPTENARTAITTVSLAGVSPVPSKPPRQVNLSKFEEDDEEDDRREVPDRGE